MTSSGHAYLWRSALCSMLWREHAACGRRKIDWKSRKLAALKTSKTEKLADR